MSNSAGFLKRVTASDGSGAVALKGEASVFGLFSADILIRDRQEKHGKQWDYEVLAKYKGRWHEVGQARFERKNASSNYYLIIPISTPEIVRKLGKALWIRAFPEGDNVGSDMSFEEQYSLAYDTGISGGGSISQALDDDEIPFT